MITLPFYLLTNCKQQATSLQGLQLTDGVHCWNTVGCLVFLVLIESLKRWRGYVVSFARVLYDD